MLCRFYSPDHMRSAVAVLILCAAAWGQANPQPATPVSRAPAAAVEKPPISVGILVDGTAVRWAAPGLLKEAVATLLRSMRDQDDYALFTAGERLGIVQEFTSDAGLAGSEIDHLQFSGRNTLYDSVVDAIRYMGSAVTNDRKALLLITGGEDIASRAGLTGAIAAARQAGIPVFIIAVPAGSWRARAEVEQLAVQSDGAVLMPARKEELAEVSEAFGRRLMGPPQTQAAGAGRHSLAGYSEVIVRSIPVAKSVATAEFQPGDNLLLQKMLVSRLQAKRIFPEVIDATGSTGEEESAATDQPAAAPHTKLELLATIVGYRPGSRLKRGTAGVLGSGVARLKVQFVLRDSATRKPVLSFVEERSGSGGLLGGSNEDNQLHAMQRVVDAAIEQLKRDR